MRTGIALQMAALVTSASAQNVNEKLPWLGGAGATLCDKWLEVREKKASVLAFGLEGWILGYVSGAVHGSSPNEETYVLSNYTESDVFGRIDSYCREHRSDMLVQAALVTSNGRNGYKARLGRAAAQYRGLLFLGRLLRQLLPLQAPRRSGAEFRPEVSV